MLNSNIKIIIFDLDGTLVDAYQAVAQSLNFSLNEVGLPSMDDEAIKRSVGWGEKKLVQKLVKSDLVERVLSIYREHHKRSLKSGTKYLPGARKLLNELTEQGYSMAIASNRPTRFTEIILKQLDARNYFKTVICADKVPKAKPAGDMLEYILKKFSLESHQAVYVGDMTIDIETANAVGMKAITVTTGSCTKDELESHNPHKIMGHLSELPVIIEDLSLSLGDI